MPISQIKVTKKICSAFGDFEFEVTLTNEKINDYYSNARVIEAQINSLHEELIK